jgi:WD40 repeat protein
MGAVEPKTAEISRPSEPSTKSQSVNASPQSSTQTSASKSSSSPQTTSSKGPQTASERYNPGWSRKFLAGKTPLIPTYDAVPPLSSLHQDSIIFKINAHLAFFPVQGPGGRLGVHPLKKKGRMVNGGEGYLSGGVEIADFDVEPFGSRVAIAGEDGLIRIWTVGEDGIQGVGPEAEQVLKGDGIDKIATIAFHPTAKDLLTVLTNDQGTCAIRLFDLEAGQEVKKIPLDLDGAFNMIWSPLGDKVAVATKDGRILTLDPRRPESQALGSAHDSPRSFQITWIDETQLLSVGFSRGSQRRINLYQITDNTIKTLSSFMMDISPSVLFPQYDPDTNILYIWGKGERQIQAFEIRPKNDLEPIAKLPSFTSGSPQLGVSFFPKRLVDVKKVEVAKVLRLTAKAIEEVSFTIPRNKPDFFQDDIYVETLDVEHDSATAEEWLNDKSGETRYLSLKPEGMTSRNSNLHCFCPFRKLTGSFSSTKDGFGSQKEIRPCGQCHVGGRTKKEGNE